MSEYDSTFAFVRLDELQEFRGMIDPETGVRSVTTIQLKLVEGADLNAVRDNLRRRFPPDLYAYNIQTWRDMQGPLLAAVRLETTILNILLFLIIAVAGFGILSTFFMIVVEKTRRYWNSESFGSIRPGRDEHLPELWTAARLRWQRSWNDRRFDFSSPKSTRLRPSLND